jgi:nicotinamidase-related amidase
VSNVVSLRAFADPGKRPTLVLIDLQQDGAAASRNHANAEALDAIANCRAALAHARQAGFPIAFVRWIGTSSILQTALPRSAWIEGFEPKRTDMVFERNRPSCYASLAFAEVMANDRGNFVLAGFGGELACLATAIEAFHRGHQFTFLSDASVSHALEDIPARDVHRTITKIIGTYGSIAQTRHWIASSTYRHRILGKKNESEHGRTAR